MVNSTIMDVTSKVLGNNKNDRKKLIQKNGCSLFLSEHQTEHLEMTMAMTEEECANTRSNLRISRHGKTARKKLTIE